MGTWQVPGTQFTGPEYSYCYVNTATTDVAPRVIGLSQAGAEKLINDLGFTVGNVTTGYSNTIPSGSIVSQSVAAGSLINLNTSIDLVVSAGPQTTLVSVPNVVGMTQAAASSALTSAGLTVGTITQAYSSTVASGSVISQTPVSGASVASGTAVNLTVSQGPQPIVMVTVPDVSGMTQANAEAAVIAAGLTAGVFQITTAPPCLPGK